jgi:cytochrome P450
VASATIRLSGITTPAMASLIPKPAVREAVAVVRERREGGHRCRFLGARVALLLDWKTFSSSRGPILEIIKAGVEIPPGTLLMEDPPAHDIHRGLLARVFTPRRVLALEPQIRALCHRALDRLAGARRFDLMAEFANEVPMRVIGMLLGIPEQDQQAVRDRADANLRTEGSRCGSPSGRFRTRTISRSTSIGVPSIRPTI